MYRGQWRCDCLCGVRLVPAAESVASGEEASEEPDGTPCGSVPACPLEKAVMAPPACLLRLRSHRSIRWLACGRCVGSASTHGSPKSSKNAEQVHLVEEEKEARSPVFLARWAVVSGCPPSGPLVSHIRMAPRIQPTCQLLPKRAVINASAVCKLVQRVASGPCLAVHLGSISKSDVLLNTF